MLHDFEVISHKIDTKDDILIYPISDVHLGAYEHKKREWELFCMDILKKENAYLTLGGDLINNTTRNSVGDIFSESLRPREAKKIMTEMLTPLKDRILCAVTGNHEQRSAKDVDDDPTYDIMCKLDLEHLYRENIAFVKIQVNSKSPRRIAYVLVVTHGSGGGALTGSAVNKAERFGYSLDNVDALIVGHTHKPFVTTPSKLHVDLHNNRVTEQPFKVINSSSWLGYSAYAGRKMLQPSSVVPQIITLKTDKKLIRVET